MGLPYMSCRPRQTPVAPTPGRRVADQSGSPSPTGQMDIAQKPCAESCLEGPGVGDVMSILGRFDRTRLMDSGVQGQML